MRKGMYVGAALLLVVVVSVGDLAAEVIPGRWEKVEALSEGASVVITMKNGDRLRYKYSGSSPTELSFTDSYHKSWVLPKSEISLITLPPKKSSKGALIGLAVGAAGGAALGAAANQDDPESAAVGIPISGLVGAGIGTLVGVVVDASTGDPVTEVLYRAQ